MNSELLPILSGLLLGSACVRIRLRWRLALLIPGLGVFATMASGEFQTSWSFLLVDIPLVAVSAAAGYAATGSLRLLRWT